MKKRKQMSKFIAAIEKKETEKNFNLDEDEDSIDNLIRPKSYK